MNICTYSPYLLLRIGLENRFLSGDGLLLLDPECTVLCDGVLALG
jgi:hypothetical protein